MGQIDPSNFVLDEFKKNNEEDVTVLSQSYPDNSPIKNAIISNQNEPESGSFETLNTQTNNEDIQNKMFDNSYNIDSKSLYQLLFEDNSKFLYDVYKSAYNESEY